jgi:hypothetical protein
MAWPKGKPRGNGAGYGGPAKGAGWGGSAKGSHRPENGHEQPPYLRGEARKARIAEKHAAREELYGVIYEIAVTSSNEFARLSASNALLDRIEGKPIQRNINVNQDDPRKLTDAELAQAIRQGLLEEGPQEPLTLEAPKDGESVN